MVILEFERYILKKEEGLLIADRKVDGDYEQHLGVIESVKEFKERNRISYMGSSLTKLK